MGAFLRQLAALGAWMALSDLLLPEGGAKRAARLVIGLMAITLPLAALGALRWPESEPAFAITAESAAEPDGGGYRRIALKALANQAARLCERMARKAGYGAAAAVYLRTDGAAERAEVTLTGGADALVSPEALAASIAEALALDASRVRAVGP